MLAAVREVGPFFEQQPRDLDVAGLRADEQRRAPVGGDAVGGCAAIEEQSHDLEVALLDGEVEVECRSVCLTSGQVEQLGVEPEMVPPMGKGKGTPKSQLEPSVQLEVFSEDAVAEMICAEIKGEVDEDLIAHHEEQSEELRAELRKKWL